MWRSSIDARNQSRSQPDACKLEIISRLAKSSQRRASILFVHGINVGGWIWEDHFLDYFAEAGFDAHAVSLRGHGQSWGADRISEWTLADYVEDLRETVDRFDTPLVLVGHSMGGAVVQQFVRDGGSVAAMALMASVPPWGLVPSAIRMAIRSPRMFSGLLAMSSGRLPVADKDILRQTLFSSDTADAELDRFLSRVGPESPAMGVGLQEWPPIAPLPWLAPKTFVLGGAEDAIVPSDEVWRTGLYYGCPAEIVPGLGHALMLGPRWQGAADRLKRWLFAEFEVC